MSDYAWTADQIADGIYDTCAAAHDWVSLTDIRAEWGTVGVTREQIDAALTTLLATRRIKLIPEANQKTLTQADWDAALWLGGEYRHLAAVTNLR